MASQVFAPGVLRASTLLRHTCKRKPHLAKFRIVTGQNRVQHGTLDSQHTGQEQQQRQPHAVVHAVAPSTTEPGSPSSSGIPKLADMPLQIILNAQGMILPEVPEGSAAVVYAIFDDSKRLQYVGFGKALRASLRTLFSRRPDKSYYFKAHHLSELDQDAMIAIRSAWFEECGGPPSGNKLALERSMWQQPAEAFTISDRGKRAAAEELAKTMVDAMRSKGCREDFQADEAMLELGQVEFVAGRDMSPEELAAAAAAAAEQRSRQRTVAFEVNGQRSTFEILYTMALQTNGGWMFDVSVTHADRQTQHRVIVGKGYYEPYDLEPRDTVAAAFEFMLQRDMPRKTEGVLLSSVFTVNYFAISELDQYDPTFLPHLASKAGKPVEELEEGGGDGGFWRFQKIHDYGGIQDDTSGWSIALDRSKP